MRSPLRVTAALPTGLLVVLVASTTLAGCSGDDAAPSAAPSSAAASTPAPGSDGSPSPSEPSGSSEASEPFVPAPADPQVAASPACVQVRAGVDAFNLGDPEETVARFRSAVPLAEEQADGSEASNQLVEAVRWYAELPPEDYQEAFATSPDFARYQAITLSQCGDGAPGEEASPPGQQV